MARPKQGYQNPKPHTHTHTAVRNPKLLANQEPETPTIKTSQQPAKNQPKIISLITQNKLIIIQKNQKKLLRLP